MAVPHLQVQEGGLEPQYTLDEVAGAVRMSRRYVEKEIAAERLIAVKLGRSIRVPLSEYHKWLTRMRLQ